MKQLILGAVVACVALTPSFGWQRGWSGGRGSTAGVSGSTGAFNCRNFGVGRNPFWGAAPWGYGENDYDDGWPPDFSDKAPAPPAGPQVIAPEAPPPPPEPVRPVIREYIWPESGGRAGVPFSIVSKDGTVRFAIAVWVQAGVLHFTAPDKTAGQIALNTVDRRATAQLNAEKRLRLALP